MVPVQPRYLPYLDGLRAVAVLLVIWSHFPFVAGSTLSETIAKISSVLRTGYIGVDLFFVLSGFLITRILLAERRAMGGISFRAFYFNRFLRIFPIYYLCVAIYAFVFARGDGDLLSLLTYTFNFYKPFHPEPAALEHTWSLSVEEQFYLIWPFLISAIPLRWGRIVTGAIIPLISLMAALIIAGWFESTLAGSIIYMSVVTRMMSLSLGAFLAFREMNGDKADGLRATLPLGSGIFVLAADNIGRAVHLVPAGGFYWSGALAGYALLSFGTIMLLLDADNRVVAWGRAFLSLGPLRYIGRISYGLYLYHMLVLFLMGLAQYQVEKTGTTFTRAMTALFVTFAVAGLSYRYLESPLLRLKRRQRTGISAEPAPA